MGEGVSQNRRILKSLFFFGSLQVIQTLIGVVKAKYTSVFIGPVGLGILTIYTTFLNTIVYLVGFGLFNSAVRNISIAESIGDRREVQKIFSLVTKIILLTFLVISVLIAIFNSHLNKLFFDKEINDQNSFIFLIVAVFFTVFASRNNMLLQGVGKFKEYGKTTLISSAISLIVSYPLFYYYGSKVIIPTLILNSLFFFIVSEYFRRPLNINVNLKTEIGFFESNKSQLIKLGFIMMLNSLIGNLVSNLINIIIVRNGSTYDLGLYNAASTISMQLVSLIFVSLSSEFYPRLSAVSHDYNKISNLVNRQIQVVLTVLLPLLFFIQIFASLLVNIVYSTEFAGIIPFIQIVSIAIVFQALAYILSNIPLAMGNKKQLFLFNSFIPGVLSLVSSIFGYKYFGFIGLSYSLYIVNILHLTLMYLAVNRSCNFNLNKDVTYQLFIVLLSLSFSLLIVLHTKSILFYGLISIVALGVIFFTFKKCEYIFEFKSMKALQSIMSFLIKNK